MNDPIAARYGLPAGEEVALNETLASILGHASCRAYLDRPVSMPLLAQLIAAAQSAPSSCNLQCWSVVAVSDAADKAELAAMSGGQSHIEKAPVLLCFLADLARIDAVADLKGEANVALDYLETLLVGVIDASLAAQNLVTAAESLGLGTCYLGGMRNDITAVSQKLGLPQRVAPVFGLTLGYPDPARAASVKPRYAARAVLHHGRYQAPDHAADLQDYEARMAAFNAGQGRQVAPWGDVSAKRIATIDRMEGRDVLWQKLRAQGLALK